MPAAVHTEVFNCTVSEFYKIVTDYEKYPQFLSEVKECKVIGNEGGKKVVEFKVSVVKTFSYKVLMTEKEPSSLIWNFTSGDIFKSMGGSWTLSDEGGKCKALYSVEATFGLFVPGPIAKTLMAVNLPAMITAYHKRVKELYGK